MDGASVVIADVDEQRGVDSVGIVRAEGGDCELFVADVSTSRGASALVKHARARFGSVDVLVNNAGIAPGEHVDTWNTSEDHWDRVIQVNLKSVYLCSREAIPLMLEKGAGAIVNVASIAATRSVSSAAYAASKGGILSYTRQVAVELASRGVRVNCVSPGFMRTPMSTGERQGLDPLAQEERIRTMGSRAPMGRAGGVADIAAMIAYLVSDDASYVTGQEIAVDGGFLAG